MAATAGGSSLAALLSLLFPCCNQTQHDGLCLFVCLSFYLNTPIRAHVRALAKLQSAQAAHVQALQLAQQRRNRRRQQQQANRRCGRLCTCSIEIKLDGAGARETGFAQALGKHMARRERWTCRSACSPIPASQVSMLSFQSLRSNVAAGYLVANTTFSPHHEVREPG